MLIGADEIELVDLTPEKLLDRLNEGKVYIPERAKTAMEKFFRKEKLVALRELSLSYTARRVEERSRNPLKDGAKSPWFLGSKIVVAVGPTKTSENLIRHASRIANAHSVLCCYGLPMLPSDGTEPLSFDRCLIFLALY